MRQRAEAAGKEKGLRMRWKDSAHLIRPGAVFLLGLVVFVAVRAKVVPPTFGQYGHYRAAALEEIRARPIRFAGQETCAACHVEQAAERGKGKHAGVACEACHGAAAAHADDAEKVKPAKLQIAALCAQCHEADTTKPKWFKQVDTKEHSGGASCEGCHQPHNPKL